MLHLVTGTPGASKTAFVVTQLDKLERSNFINVRKNKTIFEFNKPLFEKFKEEFLYYSYEQGSGSARKTIIEPLTDDYFLFLNEDFDDLRPDDYFKKTTQYNEIVDRINDIHGPQKFELLQPVRTIYTNIKACKIPYTRPLIHDWRDAPDGSVIVIDEIQLVEPYKNKKSEDPMIMELTIHRHRGFDFYIITQATRYLHPAVKELIGCHYHITRPWGWTPKVYQYGSARDNPNALVNKINCEAKFTFKPADRIFTLYKSTTINTHKKRIPKFIFFIGAVVIVMVGLFFHFATKDNVIYDQVTGKPVPQPKANQASTTTQAATTTKSEFNADTECRKAANVEKPECVKWFNDISKNGSSVVPAQQTTTNQVSYNPSKPYDDQIQKSVSYQVSAKPVFSGCVKKNGRYLAYTQQGTILHDVSSSDCKKLIDQGDRPFNYFKQEQPQIANQPQLEPPVRTVQEEKPITAVIS
ncbi:zonular occludens toxin domain-containing protein [Acinetobacter sp. AOR43_HL]|uniref:zonular occludens toxin domain-containing protein n=1 Tax=Acinetobacter sp. AOR43_HL TaxID=2919390 RepID=UPI0022EB45A4|nr:zonular occludens toxin domain-containing protein [Acinetobacter sp. AOR43_HL]MDA3451969.1 zonular occludens toxin domain-containing protein [Acinetobacter sp. AOR43_HL]MDA3453142.1 zonular occludens toxin domain-containing protein [Acinetobacter sp. AOR43_HL]